MSDSQGVSTEDLAGRQVPDESSAGGQAETSQSGPESTMQDTDPGRHDTTSGTTDDGRYDNTSGTTDDGRYDAASGTTDDGRYDSEAAEAALVTSPAPRTGDELPTDGQRESEPTSRDQDDEEDVSPVDQGQGQFQERWSSVQALFVDDPRAAVSSADALVAELMQSLAAGFADHKSRLETQWQGGGEADTEELRLALRRYRVFFQRLLQT